MYISKKHTKIIYRLLKEYIHQYKTQISIAILFMITGAICSPIIIKLLQIIIDQLFSLQKKYLLITIAISILVVHLIKGISEYFHSFIIRYIGHKIFTDLHKKMYKHILYSDLSFIEEHSSGKLISRFTNDMILMRESLSIFLLGIVKYLLSIIFLIILMFQLEPKLSLGVLLVFPFTLYPIQKISQKKHLIVKNTQEIIATYTENLDETFKSIKTIKSFNNEQIKIKESQKINFHILESLKKTTKLDSIPNPIMEILSGIAISSILWYGGNIIITEKTSPGALFAFIMAFISAYRPFKSLLSLYVKIQDGIAAAERIFYLLDQKPVIKNNTKYYTPTFISPQITYQNISLYFKKKVALKNFSFTIHKEKSYAFIGPSGGGKSSIINLLVRFYNPSVGKILIDNYNIKDIELSHLRNQISLITQEILLFNKTIIQNIAYGDPNASMVNIINAAKVANAHEFITMLPKGYNTIIGHNAFSLSLGQQQKITIARAILKNAPILILDEATSALDIKSEQIIINTITKLRKRKTTIFITHRLPCLLNVDQIVVIKSHNVIEYGTHQELLKKKQYYYNIYKKNYYS